MQWESRVSVVDSSRAKKFLATLSALVVAAAMLAGARVAMADSVWVQSYERASQTATCDDPPEPLSKWRSSWANPYDPISGPTWHPSWEQWANDGNGGWVCTRSITWARTPVAETSGGGNGGGGGGGSGSYALGDIGPGGGLVFLISGGKTYEMAPRAWGDNESTPIVWTTSASTCYASDSTVADQDCQTSDLYPGTTTEQKANATAASAVGMGTVNTDAIVARMDAAGVARHLYAAGAARSYTGGGYTDWFLPSADELNAMCQYAANPAAPPTGTGPCTGPPDAAFTSGNYGFAESGARWTSTQTSFLPSIALARELGSNFGQEQNVGKGGTQRVRPIRAF